MQNVRFVIEMIIEHGKIIAEGIIPLEKWYRKNDNNSLDSRLIKATIQSSQGNYIQAAREYEDAAKESNMILKICINYEKGVNILCSWRWME